MAAQNDPIFTVDQLSQVTAEIKRYLSTAAPEKREEAIAGLRLLLHRLRTDPLYWGDPEYRTVKEGGCVCHTICSPFFAQFVVYENEKVVCITDCRLLRSDTMEP